MQSINFNTGYKKYAINEDENNVIRVNLADLNLPTRLKKIHREISEIADRYGDVKELTPEQFTEIDTEIKDKVNRAFGSDVCTPAFGAVNCLSIIEDGKPIIQLFLEAFMPIIDEDVKKYKQSINNVKLDESKMKKYLEPVVPLANPNVTERVDLDKISQEEKNRLLAEMFK